MNRCCQLGVAAALALTTGCAMLRQPSGPSEPTGNRSSGPLGSSGPSAQSVPPSSTASAAAPAVPEASFGTLLLPVSFTNLVRAGAVPALLELALQGADGVNVVFGQRPALPLVGDSAGVADYLFRIVLPPGRYRVVRISGTARSASGGDSHFSVPLDLPLETEKDSVRYVGRLVVQNILPGRSPQGGGKEVRTPGASPTKASTAAGAVAPGLNGGVLQFNTAWSVEDDLAQYRNALANVPREAIVLQPFATLATPGRTGPGDTATARSFDELNVTRVSTILAPPRVAASDGVDLLPDKAPLRNAYRQYQTATAPKAFAVSTDGGWASATGRDAATRALTECAFKAAQRCRLFALDDRLVLERGR